MSDESPGAGGERPPVARNNSVDAVVATLLFLVGAVVVFEAYKLGAGWSSDGPGAGYFPFYIGLILCISSLGILFQATLSRHKDTATFVDREQLQRVASVFLPALAYVLATVFLGIYVASAVYIALFMVVLGKYRPLKSALIALAVMASFFLMFEVWFKVPLYKGMLEPLAFLGY
jgi:uncharacterized membrane protein YidH (DUF202 family)